MNPHESHSFISPNPARFTRRTSVTIAAGFKCTDGIVLCADTQETVGDFKKRNRAKITVKPHTTPALPMKMPQRKSEPKLREAPQARPELIAGFAGAGDSAFLEKLIDTVWKGISVPASFEDRCLALESSVIGFYEKFWPIYPESMKPEANLIVGLWSPTEIELFKVLGPLVLKVENYASIGCGGMEADSFAERFYGKKLSIKSASSVGIYILKAVKEQVPYCGGDSHLLLMENNGHTDFESPWKVKWAEEKLRRLEEAVGPLILAAASGEAETEEFQKSLDEFGGKLLVVKEELQKVERAIDRAGDYRWWK